MKEIKNGDVFHGTHADLLNALGLRTQQGLPFKNFFKGTYELDENTYIWIICIDGQERDGFINIYQGRDGIIEQNVQDKTHTIGLTHKYRIVFDKVKGFSGNRFICKGLYKLSPESTNQKRILKKVADSINL